MTKKKLQAMREPLETPYEEGSGIPQDEMQILAAELSAFLAQSYFLYLRTQNYHWNVTGPMFRTLHKMFEEQYKKQAESIDQLAERIRALGEFAPGTFQQFTQLAPQNEDLGDIPPAKVMIDNLIRAHERAASTARDINRIAEESDDDVTCDLLTYQMNYHEKSVWMLRSLVS